MPGLGGGPSNTLPENAIFIPFPSHTSHCLQGAAPEQPQTGGPPAWQGPAALPSQVFALPLGKARLMVGEGASLGETPHCGGANVWGNRARQTFTGSVFSAEVTKVQERRIPSLLGGGRGGARGNRRRRGVQAPLAVQSKVWRTSKSYWKPR